MDGEKMWTTLKNRTREFGRSPRPVKYYTTIKSPLHPIAGMGHGGQYDITVLHVEDEPSFADLTATFLEMDERHQFEIISEGDPERALDMIDEVDCIVSDYDMPGIDGLELLRRIRTSHPNLPFILFTGKGSEEIASEAISLGVTDYLQKGGSETFEILAKRIESAVIESKTRTFRHATQQDPFTMVDRITDVFIALDPDWRLTYINKSAQALFDQPTEDLLFKRLWDVVPDASESPLYDRYHKALDEQRQMTTEAYYEPWGRWYQEHLYPSGDGLSVILKDITKHKDRVLELQASEERHGAILSELPAVVTIANLSGTISYVSPSVKRLLGYEPASLQSTNLTQHVHPDAHEHIERTLDAVDTMPTSWEFATRMQHADGSWVHVTARSRSLLEDPSIDGILTTWSPNV